jgi:hypothetical protein
MQQLREAEHSLREIQARLVAEHTSQASVFVQLQQKNLLAAQEIQHRTAAEQAVAKFEEYEKEKSRTEQQLSRLLDERRTLRARYLLEREKVSQLRDQIATQLQAEAGKQVRIRILRNADNYAYQQILTAGLQGARVRNHEDILASLMQLRPEDLAQLIQENNPDEFESQTNLGNERSRKILDAFREKIDPLELEIVEIEDRICIELNVASDAEPNFKDASDLSRGQKCTALLPILLARRDTPLVIDQPEDNLDNHFIFETVVDNIRRLKHRRQMIFVTHNANIPVLAEADLIVVLDSDGHTGFIKRAGSLDECRDEIIDLLEGGKQAFELRRRRYEKP